MRHLVLGTAGHIDHGKSALVRALTGIDPDRLREEKTRGITIDLGFADLDLGEGRVASFVDVPGHERFVRRMVAGASGIDAVVLVVAADDGVRPQTREHLAICRLLEIRHGVVALTKSDLVDRELIEVVSLEIREFVADGFLAGAPVLPLSSKTGDGLEALRAALAGLFAVVPQRSASGAPRLPVDRSFTLKGFGTVVTGTLAAGTLGEGDEVEVLPGGRRGRVRGLQVHGRKIDAARAGQRTAVNLQGLSTEDVPRGSTVTVPGGLVTTRRVWATVQLLPTAPEALRRGGPVRFHHGTCERAARVRVFGEGSDGALDVEIVLHGETVLRPGDRFILRRPSPVDTVGGGSVVDAHPPRGRPAAGFGSDSWTDVAESLVRRLARAGDGGRAARDLAAELGWSSDELTRRAGELERDGAVVIVAGRLFSGEVWRRVESEVESVLTRFHADEPLRPGMAREGLRSRVARGMAADAWRTLLERLAARARVSLIAERVALAGHRVVLSERDRAASRQIDARFRQAGLDPPGAVEVAEMADGERGERLVDLLIEEGRLVRIRDGRLFHAEALADLRERLRDYATRSRTIDVPAFKALAGVTRKNAIPLLEQLDAERVTRRTGNVREILID